ncbi:MAG: SpoIIIAH-like family protein [Dorea sp.]|nr:SpoIIIAH-like family protein [Dorea sp.]MCI9248508.1 SpoIIIAH-like family protein [Dorea sp.]
MKNIFKKNQMIIAALAVMIAAAGYLNYSGRLFGDKDDAQKMSAELANQELLDISEEDLASADGEIKSQDSETEGEEGQEGTPGEAVLTSGEANAVVAQAKMTREQVRAKNKETLQQIIDNKELSNEQKKDAVSQMVKVTEMSEKEAAAETLLASKGFTDAVVSISDESTDVVVNAKDLNEASRAQITDIVTRKTGVSAESVVINPINDQEK